MCSWEVSQCLSAVSSFFIVIFMCITLFYLVQLSVLYLYLPYKSNDSVQFNLSVMSNSLRPRRLQHARFPCPSSTPRAYSNYAHRSVMPSKHLILCHPQILLPSIFTCIKVCPMSQCFASGGQSILELQLQHQCFQ